MSDALDNVTGRAWLEARFERLARESCDTLLTHYRQYRRGNTQDWDVFYQAVEGLRFRAFAIQQSLKSGACDVEGIVQVLEDYHRLDVMIHRPAIQHGHRKMAKDAETGWGTQYEEHKRWRDAHEAALRELTHLKRPQTAAARRVVERLGLDVTPESVLRAIKKLPERE